MDSQKDNNQNECRQPQFRLHQFGLPQIDGPQGNEIPKFYKQKSKLGQNLYQYQIGMLVRSYSAFQEDFINYLINFLSFEAEFLHIYVVEPNHLYISMNLAYEEQNTPDYLHTESNIYFILDYCRYTINEYINEYLSQSSLFGENTNDQQILLQMFEQKVIKKIKQKYSKMYSKK